MKQREQLNWHLAETELEPLFDAVRDQIADDLWSHLHDEIHFSDEMEMDEISHLLNSISQEIGGWENWD